MPDIRDSNTAEAIAREYILNGRKRELALVTVGYSEAYARSGKGTHLYSHPALIEAIASIEQELSAEMGWTIERSMKMLLETRQRAIRLSQPAVEVSSVVSINRMFGMDKDNDAGNKESLPTVTTEQAMLYKEMAKVAIEQKLKGPKLAEGA